MFFIVIEVLINFNIVQFPNIILFKNITIKMATNVIDSAIIIILFIKMAIQIIFQILQYSGISYEFYNTYMIYEDKFLNQHKKNILYANVKEVELRKSIWDRFLNRGIIIIYTNAENNYSNGMLLYSIKNTTANYEKIDELINKGKSSKYIEKDISKEESIINEEDFKKSLKYK